MQCCQHQENRINVNDSRDRKRLTDFLKKRLDELHVKINELVKNNIDMVNRAKNFGYKVYEKLVEKLGQVIYILEHSTQSLLEETKWLTIEELCLLADDIDESATFEGDDRINGWVKGFGHQFDPLIDAIPGDHTATKAVYHWIEPTGQNTEPLRQGSRLIQWDDLERVLEILKNTFSRKYQPKHFFMCHAGFHKDDNVARICCNLKKAFVRKFVDLCAKYEIHRYGERVDLTTDPFDESAFVAIQQNYIQIFMEDFKHYIEAPPATLPDVPLSLTKLHRGFRKNDTRDINTCWFNSCLWILSTLKEVFSKLVFELAWEKEGLLLFKSKTSFKSILKGDADVQALMDIVFTRQQNEDSIKIYESLFQVLMSTFFKEQHDRCNIHATVYTTGLRLVFLNLLSLNKAYDNPYDLSNLDILSDSDMGSLSGHIQSIISFLGHDLKKLFIFGKRPAIICQSCNRVVTHIELAHDHKPDEQIVYSITCPRDILPKKAQSLNEFVTDHIFTDFEIKFHTPCSQCGQLTTVQKSIIHSTSQYFMVHPFKGNVRARSQPSYTLENHLMIPTYPADKEEEVLVEYRLRAFVEYHSCHYTTYFTIEGNENFWIYHDDNNIPTLVKRDLTEVYAVELAIYEKVAAWNIEPRELWPLEKIFLSQTLNEIETKMHDLEELEKDNKTPIKYILGQKYRLEKYKQLLETHGDLAALVLRELSLRRCLPELKAIVIDERDSFIEAHLPKRVISTKNTVQDLITPVKEARLSDVKQDVLAMEIPVTNNEITKAGDIEDIPSDVHQPVSLAETSQVLVSDISMDTVLDPTLCNRLNLARIALDYVFLDCPDGAVPTSNEANRQWTFIIKGEKKFEVFSVDHYYLCSLPSFIWRSLNAHLCSVVRDGNNVIGTAPRNLCHIDGLGDCTIQVDLITNNNWDQFGKNASDDTRVAFAFTFKRVGLAVDKRTNIEHSFDIGVWENKTDPGEWEIGFLHKCARFFIDTERVMPGVEITGIHPFYHLLRRVIQVMTGW